MPLTLMENPASNQLSFKTHPFLYMQPVSTELKSFYDHVLAVANDFFKKCSATWSQYEILVLEVLHGAATKLEKQTIMRTI